jgi:hypothetical protein
LLNTTLQDLYGCKSWFLALRNEHDQKVLEHEEDIWVWEGRVRGEWRQFYNKEIHDLNSTQMSFSLSNQAERDEQSLWQAWLRGEAHTRISRRNIRRNHLENLGLDERSTFKWIGRSRMTGCGLDSSGPGMWKATGCCEHCNEPSGSRKYLEFFSGLRNCLFFKDDSDP